MRIVPEDIDAVLLASKTADVRLTFRRRKLEFTSQVVSDSLGIADPSDLDLSSYGTGALRVVNGTGNSLHTQYINDLEDPHFVGWTDRYIALRSGSRPGVHGERIWYQKANGDIAYRDYNSLGAEHVVIEGELGGYVVSLAPVDGGCYIYGLPIPGEDISGSIKSKFGRLLFVTPDAEDFAWPGIIYGDLGTPRYLDAVTLGGIDYIYMMDRSAGRVMEVTRQGSSWSYGRYIVPIDAIDNITGVTLRYATVIKNQIFITVRVVNSSDNNVPVAMDAIIFGPAIYDPEVLDSRDIQNYSFSRFSFLASENVGGKLILPGDGYVYYVGATKLFTSVATILVGEDPLELKHITSDFFNLDFQDQESSGASLTIQMAHSVDYIHVLDDAVFEFGYNGDYVEMGTFTVMNVEEAGGFGIHQFNVSAMTSSYAEIVLFTPHQSYYLASQDKIATDPATLMDVVVSRGYFGKVAV